MKREPCPVFTADQLQLLTINLRIFSHNSSRRRRDKIFRIYDLSVDIFGLLILWMSVTVKLLNIAVGGKVIEVGADIKVSIFIKFRRFKWRSALFDMDVSSTKPMQSAREWERGPLNKI
jgi:hypothetical protein